MTLLLAQAALSLIAATAIFSLIYAVFGHPIAPEPPVSRVVAEHLGQGKQTIFDNPLWVPFLGLGMQISRRISAPNIRKSVRQHLQASGNPHGYSVDEQLAICLVSGTLCFLGALLFEIFSSEGLFLFAGPFIALFGGAVPYYMLRSRAKKRLQRISIQLPYTMDLIALTMAAGSTFNEAVETLIRDRPEEDLNTELGLVLAEIQYGTTRSAALQNMADRAPLESLKSIVGAVIQAESLGTPLSTILKLQADMLRNRRSVRAEKLSASASLRILIPTMMILAAVVLIVFGPFVIRFLRGDFVL